MSQEKIKKFYVTTPIYYVNGAPHIGHAYTTIAADALTRYKKNVGYEVFFATGTDEHGQKIYKAAQEAKSEPKTFVDNIVVKFKSVWKELNLNYTDFIRTTEPRHIKAVQFFLNTLYQKGDIYKGQYQGWYCMPCEAFFPESHLVDHCCPDCKRPVELVKEENYFFKLSKYKNDLISYIKTQNPIYPKSRQNEVLSFLQDQELADLCISRPKSRLSWGIELPFDCDHVTYVWFDALINYVSIIGFGYDDEKFKKFWPCDYHLIGKDILRPHAVYWPIMLYAMGLSLPKKIIAHGWWTIEGEKMSKSKGNVIDPSTLIQEFGLDALRYFLLREIPFGSDGLFSKEKMINRINDDLANDLGNLVNRAVGMLYKYCDGVVPCAVKKYNSCFEEILFKQAKDTLEKIDLSMDEPNFSAALEAIWQYINEGNKYIEQKQPWVLNKDKEKKEDLENCMYNIINAIAIISIFIDPFMPDCAKKIRKQLNLKEDFVFQKIDVHQMIESGKKVEKAEQLFPRIEVS